MLTLIKRVIVNCTYLPVFVTFSWTWTGSLKTSQWSHWVQTCPLTERRCDGELFHPGPASASPDPGLEPGSHRGHCTRMQRYSQPNGQQRFSHPLGTWLHEVTTLHDPFPYQIWSKGIKNNFLVFIFLFVLSTLRLRFLPPLYVGFIECRERVSSLLCCHR